MEQTNAKERIILVVDDDKALRNLCVLRLAGLGLLADTATNGLEALQQVQQRQYNLILMDIQMPEMNGLEAAEAIRNYEKSQLLQQVPIIAITAAGATRQQCQDAGMNDYLTKPVSMDALRGAIDRWLLK